MDMIDILNKLWQTDPRFVINNIMIVMIIDIPIQRTIHSQSM